MEQQVFSILVSVIINCALGGQDVEVEGFFSAAAFTIMVGQGFVIFWLLDLIRGRSPSVQFVPAQGTDTYADGLWDKGMHKSKGNAIAPQEIIKNRATGYNTDSTGISISTYIYMPILTGGGNLYSTVDDLSKWDRAIFKNTLISKKTKEKVFTTELNNYAYGWFVVKTDSLYRVSHGGGVPGFNALIDRYPNKGLLIVVLSNNVMNSNRKIINGLSKLVNEELDKTGSPPHHSTISPKAIPTIHSYCCASLKSLF